MGYDSDYLTEAALESAVSLQDTISAIVRALNILVFLANTTVILVMLVKCTKFRRTRVYEDYNGIKTLSKALEVIVIFLAIEAVYGLTRIFSIIDAIHLINSIIPDFPQIVYVYLIFVTVILPILGCAISVFAWNYYHKTRRLFFSIYPNGVQPVDFSKHTFIPDDSFFGGNTGADLNFGGNASKPVAPVSDMGERGSGINGANPINTGAQGFYAKASAINSKSTNNAAYSKGENNNRYAANIPYTANTQRQVNQASQTNTDDFFGTGVSEEYINRITVPDEAKLEELLVQDTPETEYKVTPAQNNDGDIFGTGSNMWEAVPDMSDPLISEMLVTEEAPKTEVYEDSRDSFFGSGTTEDYMKRFTTADDDVISQLLVQDEPKEQ